MTASPDSPATTLPRAAARFGLLALILAVFALLLPATALGDDAATTFCGVDCPEEQVATSPADDYTAAPADEYAADPASEYTADEGTATDPWSESTPATEPGETTPPVATGPSPAEPTPVTPPVNTLPIVPVQPVATEPVAPAPVTPAPVAPATPDLAPVPVGVPTFQRIAPSVAPSPVPVGSTDLITAIGPSTLPDAAPDLLSGGPLSESVVADQISKPVLSLNLSQADDFSATSVGPLPSPTQLEGHSLASLLGAPAATALPFMPGFTPKSLFQAILTYVVPGDGGAYTATLAALLQLAVVLAVWMLLAPRPSSSPVPLLVASDSQGYRAVALRPG